MKKKDFLRFMQLFLYPEQRIIYVENIIKVSVIKNIDERFYLIK